MTTYDLDDMDWPWDEIRTIEIDADDEQAMAQLIPDKTVRERIRNTIIKLKYGKKPVERPGWLSVIK